MFGVKKRICLWKIVIFVWRIDATKLISASLNRLIYSNKFLIFSWYCQSIRNSASNLDNNTYFLYLMLSVNKKLCFISILFKGKEFNWFIITDHKICFKPIWLNPICLNNKKNKINLTSLYSRYFDLSEVVVSSNYT